MDRWIWWAERIFLGVLIAGVLFVAADWAVWQGTLDARCEARAPSRSAGLSSLRSKATGRSTTLAMRRSRYAPGPCCRGTAFAPAGGRSAIASSSSAEDGAEDRARDKKVRRVRELDAASCPKQNASLEHCGSSEALWDETETRDYGCDYRSLDGVTASGSRRRRLPPESYRASRPGQRSRGHA